MTQRLFSFFDTFKKGINISNHISDFVIHKQQLASAVRYWLIAVGSSLVLGYFHVLQSLSSLLEQMVSGVVPATWKEHIVIAPSSLSAQTIIYASALLGVAATAQAVIAKRPQVSKVWYILRFLWLSVIIGLVWGLSSGFGVSAFYNIKYGITPGFISMLGRAFFIIFSTIVGLYSIHAGLVFLSFGAAAFLHGTMIRESYRTGRTLLRAHWPYMLGLWILYIGANLTLKKLVLPLLDPSGALAIIVSALVFLTWPFYWFLLLSYYKGIAGKTPSSRSEKSDTKESASPKKRAMSPRRTSQKK